MASALPRAGTWTSLRAALRSRRIGAVTLQSFSSGLPLGLVWIALPAWLTYQGVNIRTVGLFSLAQAPWTFKFLWAPAMDRWSPRFLGRRRSWMLISEALLAAGIGLLVLQAQAPRVGVVAALAIFVAFCSASQDIVIDAYAVEVLERSEIGMVVGARNAMSRSALLLSGAVAITLGQRLGWNVVFFGLALIWLPLMGITVWSPEPPAVSRSPRTFREAVFEPLIGIFRRPRALEIVAFLLFFKFGENLATALTRPFLIQKCYSPEDVGLATATIGLITVVGGAFMGGWMSDRIGLGRALWLFGSIQAVGFLGYILIDRLTPGVPCASGAAALASWSQPFAHRLVMYVAVGVETSCQGMATGAFGVLLLRLTEKQFSATQYALFSSIFGLGRTIVGPPAGFLVDAIGWTPFYLLSVAASLPGLALLQRFAPFGTREPDLETFEEGGRRPVTRAWLVGTSLAAGALGVLVTASVSALLAALREARLRPGASPDLLGQFARLFTPAGADGWLRLVGPFVVGVALALAAAALTAARRGIRSSGGR